MEGKMVIVSAPSGAGKTTLVKHLLEKQLNLEFSVSATSRQPRGEEVHGQDYYFFTSEEFKHQVETDQFVEWEEVYAGTCYGTLKSELKRIWAKGNHVVFDVDVVGGLNIKRRYGKQALAVFVMPPSVTELEKRLRGRNTDDEASLQKRLEKSEFEMGYSKDFDVVVVNDQLTEACEEMYRVINGFLNQ